MRSWTFLFCCNLMWALQFTCIKLVQDQVGPMFTVWGPMMLSTIMLVPFMLMEKPDPTAHLKQVSTRSKVGTYVMLAALGVFPGQVMMTWGTRMSLATNAALLILTLPILTAIFAVIFLHEKMTLVRWISFGVAIIGVLLCSSYSGVDLHGLSFGGPYLAGNLLILAACMGSAFYNSYGKKVLEWHTPMQMLFWTYVAVCGMIAPVVIIEERGVFARIPHFTVQTWIGMALLTFFHNYLSMILFLKALHKLDAIQASLSNYLITFFGVPIAAIFLHEKLGLSAILGGVMVLISTLLITIWEELRPARHKVTAAGTPEFVPPS